MAQKLIYEDGVWKYRTTSEGTEAPPTATATALASEQEKITQEALKRQKAEEDALMKAYQTSSQGIYDVSKEKAGGLLTGAKSDIESLYGKGYADLQSLVGQESEAAIKESLRPIEGKLQSQGLLGGPSGALNEALASASERVRNAAISRLADYQAQKTGALANVYGGTASQLAGLESAYGTQSQGLQSTALQQALETAGKGTDITEKYGLTGLEAALGTNKLTLETAAEKDLAQQQADLAAEAAAAEAARKDAELSTKQAAWDRQYQSIYAELYRAMRASGQMDASASASAKAQTLTQIGPRPA